MDSDSEDDADYVPPTKENGESDGSDTEKPAHKRPRTNIPPESMHSEEPSQTKAGDEVYAEFKASLTSHPRRASHSQAPAPPEMVKIVKRYRFAGDEITEVKEVRVDSEEAKKWPLWKPADEAQGQSATPSKGAAASESGDATSVTASPATASTSTSSATAVSPSAKATPSKRPGPRKAKSKLADVPKKEPLKRLTTLDKSAMDWRAHVQGEASSDVKDELEANRRGGGYLEKVEFLQRVEARKEEVLDASKGKRRR